MCGARGYVEPGFFVASDCDAVECIVFVYLPVIPFRAVHTFAWNGNQFQMVPIRWSWDLVLKAFLQRWRWLLVILAFVFCIPIFQAKDNREWMGGVIVVLFCTFLLVGINFLLGWWDKRHRELRRVLGPHQLGTSDPATWPEDLLAKIEPPNGMSHLQAARAALQQGDFRNAMWDARFAVAREDRIRAEELTNEILADPDVRAFLTSRPGPQQAPLQT